MPLLGTITIQYKIKGPETLDVRDSWKCERWTDGRTSLWQYPTVAEGVEKVIKNIKKRNKKIKPHTNDTIVTICLNQIHILRIVSKLWVVWWMLWQLGEKNRCSSYRYSNTISDRNEHLVLLRLVYDVLYKYISLCVKFSLL